MDKSRWQSLSPSEKVKVYKEEKRSYMRARYLSYLYQDETEQLQEILKEVIPGSDLQHNLLIELTWRMPSREALKLWKKSKLGTGFALSIISDIDLDLPSSQTVTRMQSYMQILSAFNIYGKELFDRMKDGKLDEKVVDAILENEKFKGSIFAIKIDEMRKI